MNRRIQQFLVAENISQAQFADTINVARATVSHVLAGRNKPGFDFIGSISHHYPNLNIEWLITGKGKMYKTSAADNQVVAKPEEALPELFSSDHLPAPVPDPVPVEEKKPAITSEIAAADSALRRAVEKKIQSAPERNILKIIVLYDDNTFTELK